MTICRTKRQFFSHSSVFWHFPPGGINGPIILPAFPASAEPAWGCSGAPIFKLCGDTQLASGYIWVHQPRIWEQPPKFLSCWMYLGTSFLPIALIGIWGLNATRSCWGRRSPFGFRTGRQIEGVERKQRIRIMYWGILDMERKLFVGCF